MGHRDRGHAGHHRRLGLSGRLQDAVEVTLPVNPLTRAQFDDWSGQTESEAAVQIPLRQDAYRDRALLTVTVTPSMAASLYTAIDYLIHYPYGCVEQTVSSFLPALHFEQLLKAKRLAPTPMLKKTPDLVPRRAVPAQPCWSEMKAAGDGDTGANWISG